MRLIKKKKKRVTVINNRLWNKAMDNPAECVRDFAIVVNDCQKQNFQKGKRRESIETQFERV